MKQEIWKDVEDCEDQYKVSDRGRVRLKADNSIVTPTNFSGYGQITMTRNNGLKKQVFVHRLVAQTFIPNPDNKRQVNHINFDRHDNRVENLEWITQSDNLAHALKRRKLNLSTKK